MRRRQPLPGFFAFYRIIDTDEVLAEFSDGNAVWLRQTLIKTRDFDLLSVLEHFFQGIRGGDELLELGIQLLFHLYSQLVAAAAQDNDGLEQIASSLLLQRVVVARFGGLIRLDGFEIRAHSIGRFAARLSMAFTLLSWTFCAWAMY